MPQCLTVTMCWSLLMVPAGTGPSTWNGRTTTRRLVCRRTDQNEPGGNRVPVPEGWTLCQLGLCHRRCGEGGGNAAWSSCAKAPERIRSFGTRACDRNANAQTLAQTENTHARIFSRISMRRHAQVGVKLRLPVNTTTRGYVLTEDLALVLGWGLCFAPWHLRVAAITCMQQLKASNRWAARNRQTG